MAEAERFRIRETADAAKQFSKLYYENFDKHRQVLHKLYLDDATLLWNGNTVKTTPRIMAHLANLPISRTDVESIDCHPLPDEVTGQKCIVVTVMGMIKFEKKRLSSKIFSQTFILIAQTSADGTISWKIVKDSFRFVPDS